MIKRRSNTLYSGGKKTNLKWMMKDLGISMQSVADNAGVSKADVSRVMNDEMEEVVIKTVTRLCADKKRATEKRHNKILAECN